MEDNQPTTAREWLSRKRREEYKFHTQDPYHGADFDSMIKRVNASMGQPRGLSLQEQVAAQSGLAPSTELNAKKQRESLSKEILGFNLLPEK